MAAHRARVIHRGGGRIAQCVADGCPAVTGVWDTNAEARQSLDLQAHEEALDAVAAAAEGKHPETLSGGNEMTDTSLAPTTDTSNALDHFDGLNGSRSPIDFCAEV